jgi:competence protein ComEC
MLRFALALLSGTWLAQQQAGLPAIGWLLAGLLLAGVLSRRGWHVPSGLLCGLAWAGLHAHLHMPDAIPQLQHRHTYQVSGVIEGLPEPRAGRTTLRFVADSLQTDEHRLSGRWPLRVSWREAPESLRVGQRWQLPLRIRPVHGYRNPGGWDYAGWLYRQGIRYSAYVARGAPRLQETTGCCRLQQVRQWARTRLQEHLPDHVGSGMLLALVLGDRSGMSAGEREVLGVTGTSHLFAISGLHIGLAAGFFGAVVAWGWRRLPILCARIPALVAGTAGGLVVALMYALVSGFALPAQRALVMLAAAAVLLLYRRPVAPGALLGVALSAVLLFDPGAVLEAGFWLSFVAVMAIFLTMPHLRGRHWLLQAFVLQVAIGLALYPVLLAFNMPTASVGPLVNLVLVPLFGLFVVPFGLLAAVATLLLPAAGASLSWLAGLLGWIHALLAALSAIDLLVPPMAWSLPHWALLVAGMLLLFVPPGMRLRGVGLVLILGAHLPQQPGLRDGDFAIVLLDVGQGLSLLVETRRHVLLYDTGAAYPSGFNMADAVSLPYLRHRGIRHLDMLVLSHGDNDHDGAAADLLRQFRAHEVVSGEPWRTPVDDSLCRAGRQWDWDGVHFAFIQPAQGRRPGGNDASCVLLVRGPGGRVLIPGDIGSRVERQLRGVLTEAAPVDIVVAPHHGSASSSSAALIDAIGASHVLYAVGARNRYGFPNAQVAERWQQAGVRAWRTDRHGAIRFRVLAAQGVLGPWLFHPTQRRYWHLSWNDLDAVP